jgi:hypothetical protein
MTTAPGTSPEGNLADAGTAIVRKILCKRRGVSRAHLEEECVSALVFEIDESVATSRRQFANHHFSQERRRVTQGGFLKNPFSSRAPTAGDETRQTAVHQRRHGCAWLTQPMEVCRGRADSQRSPRRSSLCAFNVGRKLCLCRLFAET